jgi:hypothetical protein
MATPIIFLCFVPEGKRRHGTPSSQLVRFPNHLHALTGNLPE